jgi:hypothetical protein
MVERDAMGKNMGTHGNYGQHLKENLVKCMDKFKQYMYGTHVAIDREHHWGQC